MYRALTNDPSVFAGRVPAGPDPEFDAARALEGEWMGRFVPGPFDPDVPVKLEQLDVPTLIVWGDDDRIVPVEHLATWQAALPRARVEVFRGLGHLLFHEHAAAVDAIGDFAATPLSPA